MCGGRRAERECSKGQTHISVGILRIIVRVGVPEAPASHPAGRFGECQQRKGCLGEVGEVLLAPGSDVPHALASLLADEDLHHILVSRQLELAL